MIDPDLDRYVANTRGTRSASARVNELLRRAMMEEQRANLETEAETFFAAERRSSNRQRTRAFQKASIRTLTRD